MMVRERPASLMNLIYFPLSGIQYSSFITSTEEILMSEYENYNTSLLEFFFLSQTASTTEKLLLGSFHFLFL